MEAEEDYMKKLEMKEKKKADLRLHRLKINWKFSKSKEAVQLEIM